MLGNALLICFDKVDSLSIYPANWSPQLTHKIELIVYLAMFFGSDLTWRACNVVIFEFLFLVFCFPAALLCFIGFASYYLFLLVSLVFSAPLTKVAAGF